MRATRLLQVGVAMTATLLIAGCGGDDEETDQGGGAEGGELTAITVQETAGVPSAFLAFGVREGFFEEEGLDVQVKQGQGGAEAIPAIVSGDVQMAGSNVVSVMLGAQEGLPLQIVAPGTFAQEERANDFSAVMVKGNGPIQSPQDLEGKTLAVNTLDNIAEITALEALSKTGVDVSEIELAEVPFPDMGAAVEGDEVDAAFFIEPFFTLAEQAGAEVVARPYYDTQAGLQVGSYVATEQYIEESPDVVDAFARGVARTAEAIDEDPDAFRAALPEVTELSPELAESVVLPNWQAESDPQSLELLADLMVEYGATEEPPDVSDLIRDAQGVGG